MIDFDFEITPHRDGLIESGYEYSMGLLNMFLLFSDFTFNSLKLLWVQRFFDDIMVFQRKFFQLLSENSKYENTNSSNYILKYNISCFNPLILIPDFGKEILINDLGMLNICNSFKEVRSLIRFSYKRYLEGFLKK